MILTVALSVLVGVSLGLLGGGGSILTVPILVYAAGLEPKDGIATSLLVVGATSLAAMLVHARGGRVAWRVGALFGVASMAGAYGGGRIAHALPARALLAGFTVVMFVTAVAMMRRRRDAGAAEERAPRGATVARGAAIGLGIGALTGVIGAGGGFVIVPALVLLSGVPMRTAVGTSLLVIAMNSFAGFAGALSHATIHWSLAIAATVASVAGSVAGAGLSGLVKPESLRRGFAWLVLAMALFMAVKQLPASAASAMVAYFSGAAARYDTWRGYMQNLTPWSSLLGGALIGASASMLLLLNGRVAGISGIVGGLVRPKPGETSWRALFVAGLLAGGLLLNVLLPASFGAVAVSTPLVVAAGLLVGFGTRLGSGCTSGHGVCGLGRLSVRSLAATLTFMVTGASAAFVVRHVIGAAR